MYLAGNGEVIFRRVLSSDDSMSLIQTSENSSLKLRWGRCFYIHDGLQDLPVAILKHWKITPLRY